MTSIGWEFWGLKFSWFLTALMSIVLTVSIMLSARDTTGRHRVDTMAGDEGEDW
jgi:hypothetical protein